MLHKRLLVVPVRAASHVVSTHGNWPDPLGTWNVYLLTNPAEPPEEFPDPVANSIDDYSGLATNRPVISPTCVIHTAPRAELCQQIIQAKHSPVMDKAPDVRSTFHLMHLLAIQEACISLSQRDNLRWDSGLQLKLKYSAIDEQPIQYGPCVMHIVCSQLSQFHQIIVVGLFGHVIVQLSLLLA